MAGLRDRKVHFVRPTFPAHRAHPAEGCRGRSWERHGPFLEFLVTSPMPETRKILKSLEFFCMKVQRPGCGPGSRSGIRASRASPWAVSAQRSAFPPDRPRVGEGRRQARHRCPAPWPRAVPAVRAGRAGAKPRFPIPGAEVGRLRSGLARPLRRQGSVRRRGRGGGAGASEGELGLDVELGRLDADLVGVARQEGERDAVGEVVGERRADAHGDQRAALAVP